MFDDWTSSDYLYFNTYWNNEINWFFLIYLYFSNI
jgi:hypothetical protein